MRFTRTLRTPALRTSAPRTSALRTPALAAPALTVIACAALALAGGPAQAAQVRPAAAAGGAASPVEKPYEHFLNDNSRKCLYVPGSSVVQEPCNYAHPPKGALWYAIPLGYGADGWGIFQNPNSLLCLNIKDNSERNNAVLIQSPCRHNASKSEWFKLY